VSVKALTEETRSRSTRLARAFNVALRKGHSILNLAVASTRQHRSGLYETTVSALSVAEVTETKRHVEAVSTDQRTTMKYTCHVESHWRLKHA
jgi:hypothetical protein